MEEEIFLRDFPPCVNCILNCIECDMLKPCLPCIETKKTDTCKTSLIANRKKKIKQGPYIRYIDENSLEVTRSGQFRCPLCRTRFDNRGKAIEHLQRHGVESQILKMKNNVVKTEDGRFQCPLCPKTFAELLFINCHLESHAAYTNVRTFQNLKVDTGVLMKHLLTNGISRESHQDQSMKEQEDL